MSVRDDTPQVSDEQGPVTTGLKRVVAASMVSAFCFNRRTCAALARMLSPCPPSARSETC